MQGFAGILDPLLLADVFSLIMKQIQIGDAGFGLTHSIMHAAAPYRPPD